jgi:hypothetical protein
MAIPHLPEVKEVEEAAEVLLEAPEPVVLHWVHLLELLAVYVVEVPVLVDAITSIVGAV